MKNNQSKAKSRQLLALTIFAILTILFSTFGAYKVGFALGIEHHKDTQIVYGSGHDFYSEYNGQTDHYWYDNCTTVQSVVDMDSYDNILIKDSQGYIVYNGTKDGLTLNLKERTVNEIATCEDTENTLCIFVQ